MRKYVFFWETSPGCFIFESARERSAQLGRGLTDDQICRNRLKEGNKKSFDWENIRIYPIDLTEWIAEREISLVQQGAKDTLRWTENSILRKVLVASGFPIAPGNRGREHHSGSIHDAVAAINEYLYGIPTAKHFVPKTRTTKRLINFAARFLLGEHSYRQVLYGVTMGAGKTGDFLQLAQFWHQTTNQNVHLCVTSVPNTQSDLANDIRDGVQFQNIVLVVPDKTVKNLRHILKERVIGFSQATAMILEDKTTNYIVSVGVQDARGNAGTKYQDFFSNFSFGIYAKDEVHTNQSHYSKFEKTVGAHLKCSLAVFMTGTPEKFILECSDFVDENSILFSANDLFLAQAEGDPDWQGYPQRNFYVNDYATAQSIFAKHAGLLQDQLWTLDKQWQWDKTNSILMHDVAIRELVRIRFGIGAYADDPRSFFGPGSRASTLKKKTVIVTLAPGDTAKKTKYVARMIEEETGYTSFSAHDPNGYQDWLNYCKHKNGNSVFVTHDKDMTGKNNPWINVQWISMPINSSVRAGQHIGRGNRKLIINGASVKHNVDYFFDDPETALGVILDPIEATGGNKGATKPSAELIYRMATFWFEGSERWRKAEVPDISALIISLDPVGTRGLKSSRHINPTATCPAHLLARLMAVKGNSGINVELSSIAGNKGKNRRRTNTPPTEKKIDYNNIYRKNLQKSIQGFAKAVVRTDGVVYTVDGILKNPEIVVEGLSISLEDVCKPPVTFSELRAAFKNGDINEISVNKCLSVIQQRLLEADETITTKLAFLSQASLFDDSTKLISEPLSLLADHSHHTLRLLSPGQYSLGDLCAGNGSTLITMMQKSVDFGIEFPSAHVYFNDIDPIMVHAFRKLNKKYSLGIPEVNITCIDALKYHEETGVFFDVGVGNPPFNVSNIETGNGTGGNVNLYKQISDAYPIRSGGTKALITPKGMIRHLRKDRDFSTKYLNLMTEKDYWKYNTCFWVAKREDPVSELSVADRVISKIVSLGGNSSWRELNGEPSKSKLDYEFDDAVDCVVELPTATSPPLYRKVNPDYKAILYGPKFAATLFDNQFSYFVTDSPICAKFSGVILTESLADAEKIKLFVTNSRILSALHKRLKFKGKFWTLRHLKPFNPAQIKTGLEIPVEWNLSNEDIEYLKL